MSNSSSSVQKIIEKTGKKLVDKTAKKLAKVVESISSTESSVMTPSISEHSVHSVAAPVVVAATPLKQKFQDIVGKLVSHKKFKWVVLTGILIIILFFYFKSQNKASMKKTSEKLTNDEKFKIVLDTNGKPSLVDNKNLPEKETVAPKLNKNELSPNYIAQMEQLTQMAQNNPQQMTPQQVASLQLASQQMALQQMVLQREAQNQMPQNQMEQNQMQQFPQQFPQHFSQPQPQYQQQMPMPLPLPQQQMQQQQMPLPQTQQPPKTSMQSKQAVVQPSKNKQPVRVEESSEDDLSEDDNVSAHNLTLDEMETINKQLENISTD